MKYLDTSLLVSVLSVENTTTAATAWLEANIAENLSTSLWTITELGGALARKRRMSRMDEAEQNRVMNRFTGNILPRLNIVPIEASMFQRAFEMVQNYQAGIRSGDALHLAIASGHNRTLVTFDKAFAAGAAELGYAVELIA